MVYLQVEQIADAEECDYWTFPSLAEALEWLADYPIETHFWVLSSEPVGLPESEYTPFLKG